MEQKWQGIIKEYWNYLPVSEKTPIVTLKEGNTPLIEANSLRKYIKLPANLYLKYEGVNPTGSFKDRGMTMAISKALEEGAKAVVCASTGNTAASCAAYAAKAGIQAIVIIPEGKISLGKLVQTLIHGAKTISIKGNFDQALEIVKYISQNHPVKLVNSIDPYRLEGQKTAAFEICDGLDRSPNYHFIPVGNAGNITAYWKGYKEYWKKAPKKFPLPKMMGFQAEGAAPIVKGCLIEKPETVASAIRIGNPARWQEAEEARDSSGGIIDMVSDEEIVNAYKLIAQKEGIFCEPASAVSIAGVIKMNQRKIFKEEDIIICTLTGHGLKDPDIAIEASSQKPVIVEAEAKEIIKILGF